MAGERTSKSITVDTDHTDDDQNIDALLTGEQWDTTSSNVITFSFTDSAADYSYSLGTGVSFAGSFNFDQRAAARDALANFADVADVVFSELAFGSAHGTLRFAEFTGVGTAFGYYPNGIESGGDMAFNTTDYNTPTLGSFAYHTVLHEIGHAMGLKHGHDETAGSGFPDVGDMTDDRDGMEWSVMTYNSFVGQEGSPGFYTNVSGHYAQTLMVYDLAALHRMYGANYDTNDTGSTYTFSTTTGEMSIDGVGQGTPDAAVVFRTVWDGGGADTYDLSNFTTDLELSLQPGGYSNFDATGDLLRAQLNAGWDSSGSFVGASEYEFANGHLWNALMHEGDTASLIENATGGTGDDLIEGNKIGNTLTGGRGVDELAGVNGDDVLYGGGGFDLLFGGGDDDSLIGGGGEDELQGNDGTDQLFGGGGSDTLFGQAGGDTLEGGDSGDRLVGGGGADLLVGGLGSDSLYGGKGADELRGGKGVDVLEGGDDGDILKGQKGNDTLKGNAGADRLDGGEGNDRLTGGAGADVFVYNGNADEGTDRITDFDNGTDMIEISGATTFGDLAIAAVNGNTQVTWDLNKIIIEGITSGIGSSDFDFV